MTVHSSLITKPFCNTSQLLLLVLIPLLSPNSFLVPTFAFSVVQPLVSIKRGTVVSTTGAQSQNQRGRHLLQSLEPNHASDKDEASTNAGGVEPVYESVVRMDDGGSDLSNRFKYKVNALMGVFDPQSGVVDDEYQSGNIVNALVTFPARYSFNCVGKTNGDKDTEETYVNEIKETIASLSGDQEGMTIRITPRGRNFTRITLQATVDSVAIINSIYDALEKNDKTVMQY